jgi:hypothetical protein
VQIPVGIKNTGQKNVNYNESKKGRKNSRRRINMERWVGGGES